MVVLKELEIKGNGSSFSAFHKAEAILKGEGYSVGIMCRDNPIGFSKKYGCIAKWRNLTVKERTLVDGVITSNDFRDGDVKITYYKK